MALVKVDAQGVILQVVAEDGWVALVGAGGIRDLTLLPAEASALAAELVIAAEKARMQ